MTRCNRTLVLVAAALLAGLSTHEVIAQAAAGSAVVTSRSGGFLTPSDRREPRQVYDQAGGLVDTLCAQAGRNSKLRCPSSLPGFPGPTDEITAGLPHLRLNIILREMSNVVVSGSGVDSLGPFQDPWAT